MSRTLVLLAVLLPTPEAFADVLVVGPPEAGLAFSSIQAAVEAAAPGDLILVRAGEYLESVTIAAPLTLMGEPDVEVELHGTLRVSGIAAGEQLLFADFEVRAPNEHEALGVTDCAGVVRFQGAKFVGGKGNFFGAEGSDGAAGARIVGSVAVSFVDCTIYGGSGSGDGLTNPHGGHGAQALIAAGSPIALHGCLLVGGSGGWCDPWYWGNSGGDGGDACEVESLGVFVAGSTLRGGEGGFGPMPGTGGDCIEVAFMAGARVLDTVTEPGQGGSYAAGPTGLPGEVVSGPGIVHWIDGTAREIGAAGLALAGAKLELELRGEAGDEAWVFLSETPAHVPATALDGLWFLERRGWLADTSPVAILGRGATAAITLKLPPLAPDLASRTMFVQALVRDARGEARLSNPIAVVSPSCVSGASDCNANGVFDTCELLAATSGDLDGNGFPDECDPDCNANGVPDAADIALGTSPDLNQNGVPDECEPHGLTWHIDASAPSGGDGSLGAPFDELADAFEVALPTDTILVAPGLYVGARNRNQDFFGRDLAVIGTGGAAACIIDCELQGRAFLLENGETAASRIEGLTIRNGQNFSWSGGGAIHAEASPAIVACVFRNCRANRGGAISLWSSSSEVRDCEFIENGSEGTSSHGGAIHAISSTPEITRCDFVSNSAGFGGAVKLSSVNGAVVHLRHCRFLGNRALTTGGGGLLVSDDYDTLIVLDHTLFAGNTSKLGGSAAWLGTKTRMTSSTLVANRSDVDGSLAAYYASAQVELRDVVIWDDLSPSGHTVVLAGQNARLGVDHGDLEGGIVGLALHPDATLLWGDGNLDLDPLFVDADGPDDDPLTLFDNDWRLGPGSPCVDAGDNAALAPDGADLDGDGNLTEPVPFDLDGAPRRVDDPAAPDTGAGRAPLVDIGSYERQG